MSLALPCVWALGRLVESQLLDVTPTDPATIAAATVLLWRSVAGCGADSRPPRLFGEPDGRAALRVEVRT